MNPLDVFAQNLGRSSIKSVKVETSLLAPIVLTGDEIFSDDGSGVPAQVDWILRYIRPAVTIELADSFGMQPIVIAPAGVPSGHSGWMGLAFAGLVGAAGLFVLGYWAGRRSA